MLSAAHPMRDRSSPGIAISGHQGEEVQCFNEETPWIPEHKIDGLEGPK